MHVHLWHVLWVSAKVRGTCKRHTPFTACELICSASVFQAHFPFAFITIAVGPDVHAVAVSLRFAPLAHVRVGTDTLPEAMPVLESSVPFAIVDLSVCPPVHTVPVRLAIGESTLVGVTILVPLKSVSMPLII